MRTLWIVYGREITQTITSPFSYLIAAGFLLVTGIAFNNEVNAALLTRQFTPDLIPSLLTLALVFVAPVLTMHLLAEEVREGRMELYLTAPVPTYGIVFGKFLAVWTFYSVLLALTLVYPILLSQVTYPDLAHAFAAYIGIWLYGGATLAVGLLTSGLTDSQLLAAFMAVVVLLVMYLGDYTGSFVTSVELAWLLRNLTLQGHFSTSFAIGVIRPEDIVFFAGMIALCLYGSIQLVESRRWR
jgi:ABC-2 type transport system permease protein